MDEIHQALCKQLVPLDQTISRREILFLFEAYIALLRAGTEVQHDEAWKEQVRENTCFLQGESGPVFTRKVDQVNYSPTSVVIAL